MTTSKTSADLASSIPNIDALLIRHESFFNHVHVVEQEFDILPRKNHYGMAINYIDLLESREQFVRELLNTVLDWVYSQAKQANILSSLRLQGRTDANAFTELFQKAGDKFRKANDGQLLQGQFGELLLANCLQNLFNAVPILRKIPLTTSPAHERFGVDAIHYSTEGNTPIIHIGEAKGYTSKYSFNSAFGDAISSILKEYNNHQKEIRLYLHEDFLDDHLQQVATDYINGNLVGAQVRLVSIVIYEETKQRQGNTRDEILESITQIITDRYKNFNNTKIDFASNQILSRITYIAFPVWGLGELIKSFAEGL